MRSVTHDLLVVGGGAAGLMAAGFAAERGLKTLVLERNDRVGRKLGITGKGRCNVTNNTDVREVVANIPRGGKFLYGPLSRFGPADVMDFFERRGVPLKTERGGRVFPQSDRAADIVNALRGFCREGGVDRVTARVIRVLTEDGCAVGVASDSGIFKAGNILLATGGVSYPDTGSTGDGYRMASELGHTVISPRASLVPLETEGDVCASMQGFSLKNVRLYVYDCSGKMIYEDFGELMFTHFGVSGPLILSASAHMRDFDANHYRLRIDLKPALDEKKLDQRILRDFMKFSNRNFENALGELAGRSMIPAIVSLSGIPPDTKVNSITREQRHGLVKLFKGFPLTVKGPRPVEEAIITSGGVALGEVDSRTMESKLVRGLYFAGELLDADGYTGGFNLQIAWSTAYTAAMSVTAGGDAWSSSHSSDNNQGGSSL